jgi:hypothetical protein
VTLSLPKPSYKTCCCRYWSLVFLWASGSETPWEKRKIRQQLDALQKNTVLVFFGVFFSPLYRNTVMGTACFAVLPAATWTQCGKVRRTVRVVQLFWFFYPKKGPSEVLLFWGWPREFAETRITNPRNAKAEYPFPCYREVL